MNLIADSGSTKTDWLLTTEAGEQPCGGMVNDMVFQTGGCNPYFMRSDEMESLFAGVSSSLPPSCQVKNIYFYGAGCTPGAKSLMVADCLRRAFGITDAQRCVEVSSDMLGAARSLCGTQEGIACIMGTGSNSCLYDGREIVANVSPLGFILGDEGSGANLGKLLVGNILKNQLGDDLKEEFTKAFGTASEIIDRVYRQPFPNRWLASLSPFIHEHLDNSGIKQMVMDAFAAFFRRNTALYNRQDLKIGITGSVAYWYKDIIAEVAEQLGLSLGNITKSPIEGLKKFHHG